MVAGDCRCGELPEMISYAQNLEDVILWRALSHVRDGFYVDVGANDPVLDSVTKWFYDQGWHGINIEPSDYWHQKLIAARSRDINIYTAVGDAPATLTFFEVMETGLSTLDSEIARRYREMGQYHVDEKAVSVVTLTELLEQHLPANQDVHFLKVDVEGFETQVIEGLDLGRFRPWVILIESTFPQSQQPADRQWEPKLFAAGYKAVYFDGLNTFYLSKDHPELKQAFGLPPNVFDEYVTSKVVALDSALQKTQKWGFDLDRTISHLNLGLRDREHEISQLNEKIEALDKGLWSTILFEFKLKKEKYAHWWMRQKYMLREQGFRKRLSLFSGKLCNTLAKKKRPEAVTAVQTAHTLSPCEEVDSSYRFHPAALSEFPTFPETLLWRESDQECDTSSLWFQIFGHVSSNYSLSLVNRGLAQGLEGICPGRVGFKPFHGEAVEFPEDIPADQVKLLKTQFTRALNKESAEYYRVSISHHYPVMADPEPADLNLALFFWEESVIPLDTILYLKKNFDGVLVASSFVKAALRNSGCDLPIGLVPLGLPVVAANASDTVVKESSKFRFLHVSSCFPRKGVDALLKAFFKVYTGDDDVELYIKTFPNCHNSVLQQLGRLRSATTNPPTVIIDEASLTDSEMLSLYMSADTVVLPSRGEGFNLPAAEAQALGIPLIVTGYGAHTDFATLTTASLIPFSLKPSISHVQSFGSCWAEPDVKSLARLMKSVQLQVAQKCPVQARKLIATQSYIRDTYTWQQCASAIRRVVNRFKHNKTEIQNYHLAVVSSWNCRCGIAEYTRQMLLNFKDEWFIDIYCDDRTSSIDGSKYYVSWSVTRPESVLELLEERTFYDYDVLILQHQPSLFQLSPALCQSLGRLVAQGVVVILELHATKPLLRDYADCLEKLAPLHQLSRLVVHNVEDLNNMLQLGFATNVVLMPHGAIYKPDVEPSTVSESVRKTLNVDFLIGTFGFALPHKGVDQIIRALPGLDLALGRRVGLLALTSALDDRSLQTILDWKAVADEVGVADRIHWILDYRSIDECLDLLAACNVIVYPYRDTLESASGAVTVGLSSLRPVVVSHGEIFSDLVGCTYKMSGAEAGDIVCAISKLENTPGLIEELRISQKHWLEIRSWEHLSSRYSSMSLGLLKDIKQSKDAGNLDVKPSRNQLFVDVSAFYQHGGQSGIQRVVRSILNALDKLPPADFVIRPIYSFDGTSYRYTAKFTPANSEMVVWDECVVCYKSGDVFLGLDLTAHLFPNVEVVLSKMKASGVKISYVLYDVLPLSHPEWFPPGLPSMFQNWLGGLARYADQILAISDFSAECARQWLSKEYPGSSVKLGSFKLGSDFDRNILTTGFPELFDQTLSNIKSKKTCIAVGTVEVRKGYDDLLDAFEMLWAKGVDVNLLIIGRQGWHSDALIERLSSHILLGRNLSWIQDASDECLERCYAESSLLVAASYDEGFGLPLIEAAHRGLLVVARDIPVFREVAGKSAIFFSGPCSELASKVEYALSFNNSKNYQMPGCVNWEDSKNSLLAAMFDLQTTA